MSSNGNHRSGKMLRSEHWWNNSDNPHITALYLERYLNYELTMEELRSGKPVIGIAQTGSDLSPCNRIHQQLALRVRDGIREAGGLPLEFPVHPIQETGKRPTASIDRNLTGQKPDAVGSTRSCDLSHSEGPGIRFLYPANRLPLGRMGTLWNRRNA